MTEPKGNRAMFLPFAALLLGAGLALLFAPRSGKETRDKMRNKAKDVKDQADKSMSNVKQSLEQSIQEAQDLKRRMGEAMKKPQDSSDNVTNIQQPAANPGPAESSVLSTWEEEV